MAGFPLSPSFVKRTIRHNSIRKGLLGGSRFWLSVFAAGYVARWSGKVTKRGDAPLRFSESLKVGETLEIRHLPAGE